LEKLYTKEISRKEIAIIVVENLWKTSTNKNMNKRKKKHRNLYFEASYEILKDYCQNSLRLEVVERHHIADEISYWDREITINSQHNIETKVYVLLHEMGHALAARGKYYAYKHSRANKKYARNVIDKVATVGEEFEAWDRGLMLAKRLGIQINRDKFDHEKSISLATWFKWALKRGNQEY